MITASRWHIWKYWRSTSRSPDRIRRSWRRSATVSCIFYWNPPILTRQVLRSPSHFSSPCWTKSCMTRTRLRSASISLISNFMITSLSSWSNWRKTICRISAKSICWKESFRTFLPEIRSSTIKAISSPCLTQRQTPCFPNRMRGSSPICWKSRTAAPASATRVKIFTLCRNSFPRRYPPWTPHGSCTTKNGSSNIPITFSSTYF